jgi:hypothetical protein
MKRTIVTISLRIVVPAVPSQDRLAGSWRARLSRG